MNGQVERVQDLLASKTRALLRDSGLDKSFWPFAMDVAAYLLNRLPHDGIDGLSPIEKSTGNKPDLGRLRIFGCKAYVQIPKTLRKEKLSDVAWEGLLVRYSTQSPEWKIYDPRSRRVRNSYSVAFNEKERGCKTLSDETQTQNKVKITYDNELFGGPGGMETKNRQEKYIAGDNPPQNMDKKGNSPKDIVKNENSPQDFAEHNDSPGDPASDQSPSDSGSEFSLSTRNHQNANKIIRKGTRVRKKFNPNHMPSGTLEMETLSRQIENDSSSSEESDSPTNRSESDFGVNAATDTVNYANTAMGTEDCTTAKNVNANDADTTTQNILPGSCMALILNNDNTPRGWRQAMNVPEWEKAMMNEITELESKQAWEIVPRPKNKNVLPGVWNFRVKKDENSEITKYKARWCVDGSREGFLRPPENVFSPVTELSTVRTVVAIAAAGKHTVLQADFPNAYVNAEIGEDIYVTQPKGLESRDPSKYVCKLKKALYGCSISGKRWNEVLSSAILPLRYKRSFIDHCLFHRENDGHRELLIIYVDDVLVLSEAGESNADAMLDELGQRFEIKKLGNAKHILGLGIHQSQDGILMEQSAYIESILEETGYTEAKTRSTPWDAHYKEDPEKLSQDEVKLFRRTLGQIAYLAILQTGQDLISYGQ